MLLFDVPIYCINLKRRPDRFLSMSKQFKHHKIIKNATFVNAVDANSLNKNNLVTGISVAETACLYSHILAISKAIKGGHDWFVVMEDDCNISNASLFDACILDIIKANGFSDGIFQLQPIVRLEHDIPPSITPRIFWNFGTGAYLINKKHAARILDSFSEKKLIEKNFVVKKVLDSRSNDYINTRPTAEEVLFFDKDRSHSLPVFTTILGDSDLVHNNRTETLMQEKRSNNIVDNQIKLTISNIQSMLK